MKARAIRNWGLRRDEWDEGYQSLGQLVVQLLAKKAESVEWNNLLEPHCHSHYCVLFAAVTPSAKDEYTKKKHMRPCKEVGIDKRKKKKSGLFHFICRVSNFVSRSPVCIHCMSETGGLWLATVRFAAWKRLCILAVTLVVKVYDS
jgi:hypothetical protein